MYHSNSTYYSTYYRYGYQGQFAEKDPETGLNSFEARMYDSRIGRWLTTDPAGQYWSPYMGMGNVPSSNVDANGKTDYRTPDGVIHTIEDGVQISYPIEEYDYKVLEYAFRVNGLDSYNELLNRIQPNSEGYFIAVTARGYQNSTSWAYGVKKDNFNVNSDKCNKFVYDVLLENGIKVRTKGRNGPPLAGEWAAFNSIANMSKITNNVTKLGDVLADGHDYYESPASGHVVIVTYITIDGTILTTGAGDKTIYWSNWGQRVLNRDNTFRDRGPTPYKYDPIGIWRAK